MKRQREFLTSTQEIPKRKKAVAVTVVPEQPKLNRSQALQVQRMISRSQEKKWAEPGIVTEAISIAGTVSSLMNITQGTGQNNRVGDDIRPKMIKLRLDCTIADATNVVRFIVFRWKENDQFVAPVTTSILDNGLSGAPDIWSFYNKDTSQSYEIIYDTLFCGAGGSSASNLRQFRVKNIPLKGKVKFYSDASTNGSNKLYALRISDSAAVSHPTLSWLAEVTFTDA